MSTSALVARVDPDSLQRSARALGDPTRHEIFRYIAEASGAVAVAELTEFLGLNHNAVRQHLSVLKQAGLVLEAREARKRPGRPRLLYRLNPEARGAWGTDGPYEHLASLLSEALRTGDDPTEVGRRDGRRRGRRLLGVTDTFVALEEDMRAGGFKPERSAPADGCGFVLGRCPFAEVAAADPGTVCQLHLGMAQGLAETIGEGAVVSLVAKDPRQAGCQVRLRVPDTGPGAPFRPGRERLDQARS